ncbi:MAG: hypothetical protein MMC33_002262 [Icmadophila ericetorum]|nr:hypothetical protein [Icmadophila ericetorum]
MVRFDKEDLSSLSAYGGEEFELKDAAITKRILRVSFEFLAFLLLACIGSAGYLSTTWEKEVSAPQYTDGKSNLVNAVLESAPLTDGHNDFAIWLRAFHGNRIYGFNSTSSIDGQVDMPRIVEGRLQAQFWSVYVPCPEKEMHDFPSPMYYETIHDTLQQIDLVHRLIDAFPSVLRLARSAQHVRDIFNAPSKQVASLMGAEGLHQIGNSASVMRLYYSLGVRYITLTHDCNNRYADAALAPVAQHNGLSAAGIELIHEMNRLGMIVDLSHTSDETMRAALNVTKAPVIFSHSNARALCDHPRNVPDDVLRLVRRNKGVVMATFYPTYTNCNNPESASLKQVADHIMYIGQTIGFDHVGIGSDFDGMQHGPIDLEDVSKYPALIEELACRGLGKPELMGIIGSNVLRVLDEVDLVARELKHILPLEDEVEPFPHVSF